MDMKSTFHYDRIALSVNWPLNDILVHFTHNRPHLNAKNVKRQKPKASDPPKNLVFHFSGQLCSLGGPIFNRISQF